MMVEVNPWLFWIIEGWAENIQSLKIVLFFFLRCPIYDLPIPPLVYDATYSVAYTVVEAVTFPDQVGTNGLIVKSEDFDFGIS